MAGGGDSVISVEAFNFLEVSVFGLHTFFWIRHFQWFSGSCSSCSCLSVGLPESSAVRGSIRLPRCSLRGRPGVLYDGLLAPLVSPIKCLMDGWMDGWVVYI